MGTPYDLIVVGGGPAGEKGAALAAYFGKRVALVEREPHLGGACVNTGTIPSKTLRETCLHLSGFRQRGLPGLAPQVLQFGAEELMGRARAVVDAERARIRLNLDRHGVEVVQGSARFVDPRAIEVDQAGGARRLEGARFLLAVGSSPHHPPGIDFEHPRVYDSDTILRLPSVPESLIVIGAGVIGCEYATMFAALGLRVVLIEPRNELLPFLDHEMSSRLREAMVARLGMDLRLGAGAERVEVKGAGVEVRLSDGAVVRADRVLFAAGRTGNTAGLGLEAAGISPGKRGLLEVDAKFRTSVPHVYAVGDVIGFPALASVSMEQARVAVGHALDLPAQGHVDPLLPYGIYTIPEVSMIGDTEEAARAKGIDVETGRASYAANTRAQIIGDRSGLLKLVFRREDRKLLGAHLLGENATDLLHVASAVLHLGGTIDAFIEMVFNYPTLSDVYKYAAYDGLGRLAGRPGPSSVTRVGP